MAESHLPMRQVHLDFHTSPDIPDVGADWDADLFARTLTEAHVNSINLFVGSASAKFSRTRASKVS